jgi:hypothetical protein
MVAKALGGQQSLSVASVVPLLLLGSGFCAFIYQTTSALELFEPHAKWDLRFLEMREACYQATHNPRLKQASRDLEDFLEIRHSLRMSLSS